MTRSLRWDVYWDLWSRDYLFASADHVGVRPFVPLSATFGAKGTAEWEGSLLGVNTHHEAFLAGYGACAFARKPVECGRHARQSVSEPSQGVR